jgi:hypothetical protein
VIHRLFDCLQNKNIWFIFQYHTVHSQVFENMETKWITYPRWFLIISSKWFWEYNFMTQNCLKSWKLFHFLFSLRLCTLWKRNSLSSKLKWKNKYTQSYIEFKCVFFGSKSWGVDFFFEFEFIWNIDVPFSFNHWWIFKCKISFSNCMMISVPFIDFWGECFYSSKLKKDFHWGARYYLHD